jgi:hypothetical protein
VIDPEGEDRKSMFLFMWCVYCDKELFVREHLVRQACTCVVKWILYNLLIDIVEGL